MLEQHESLETGGRGKGETFRFDGKVAYQAIRRGSNERQVGIRAAATVYMDRCHETSPGFEYEVGMSPKKLSKTMTYIDKVGAYSSTFSDWLELLPAGDYGSR